jgi:adenylate kinase
MILLMGIAGSGKGTQGKMLADEHKFHLVSMGDVLRMYVTGELREKMLRGELLDDNDIIGIIDGVLRSMKDNEQVVLDGFPRTIPQAEWLLEQAKTGRFKLEVALHLVASKDAVKERLLSRARIDDKEDAIEARFSEYERSTMPLIEWLKSHGVKVVNINAEQVVDKVHGEIAKNLGL